MFSSSMFSFLNEIITFDIPKTKGSKKRVIGVGEDDEKCPKPLVEQAMAAPEVKSKTKKRVSFETKPLVYGEKSTTCDMKKGNELKMKILMTKEEAARLLAKCKDGGRLEFRDVASELMQIPIARVNLVSSSDDVTIVRDVDRKV